jgi:AAA+ ATPase superfamily predicted ATPase
MTIIGRRAESLALENILNSNRPEFIAIYGRRRVGKTYLVREFFKKKKVIFFNATGAKEGTILEQIEHFTQEIGNVFYGGAPLKPAKTWNETFALLTKSIKSLGKNKKVVLFLDEIPWMATKKSRLLQSLDYYWNQYWSNESGIKLIICGSSASWIINKIINDRGGLHNRITRSAMLIEPLKLSDTKELLNSQGVKLNNGQIVQVYMLTGGVPYYLSNVPKGKSASQIIEQLAFTKNSLLINEFDNLFSSLFNNHEIYEELIRVIANYQYGIGQEELFKLIDKNIKGSLGLTKLNELEEAGFIARFTPHLHKKRGIYYKVIDEYSLFYLKWIEPIKSSLLKESLEPGYWEQQQNSAGWKNWSGLAFESICYKHLPEIRKALKLNTGVIPSTWRYSPTKGSAQDGAQIDLLFDRNDDAITVCEIKYSNAPFVIDKQYYKLLKNRIDIFKNVTRTNKQVFLSLISANGVKETIYSEEIDGIVTLDDLFM